MFSVNRYADAAFSFQKKITALFFQTRVRLYRGLLASPSSQGSLIHSHFGTKDGLKQLEETETIWTALLQKTQQDIAYKVLSDMLIEFF